LSGHAHLDVPCIEAALQATGLPFSNTEAHRARDPRLVVHQGGAARDVEAARPRRDRDPRPGGRM